MLPEEKPKDKVDYVKQKVQEIQSLYEYSIKPHKNHILYEIDIITAAIREAQFDRPPVVKWEDAVNGSISVNKKITKKPNCIYISAMNKKNAVKILNKIIDKVRP